MTWMMRLGALAVCVFLLAAAACESSEAPCTSEEPFCKPQAYDVVAMMANYQSR